VSSVLCSTMVNLYKAGGRVEEVASFLSTGGSGRDIGILSHEKIDLKAEFWSKTGTIGASME
jgi:hypothetical protein